MSEASAHPTPSGIRPTALPVPFTLTLVIGVGSHPRGPRRCGLPAGVPVRITLAVSLKSSDRDMSLKSKSDDVVTAQKPRDQTQSPAYACETMSLGPTCVRPHALALAPCRPSHCEAAGSARRAHMAASVTAFMSPGHRALLSLRLQSCFPTPLTVPYSLICFLSITDCHMPV